MKNDQTRVEKKIVDLQNRLDGREGPITDSERQKLELDLGTERSKLWNRNRHAASPRTKSTWR